jgi:hypothetical protein
MGHVSCLINRLHPASHHLVGTGRSGGVLATGAGHHSPFTLGAQVQVDLQQPAQQLTPGLGEHLLQPVMGERAGRGVGELSDQTVEAVLRLRKAVSRHGCVMRFCHRACVPERFEKGVDTFEPDGGRAPQQSPGR